MNLLDKELDEERTRIDNGKLKRKKLKVQGSKFKPFQGFRVTGFQSFAFRGLRLKVQSSNQALGIGH